MRKHIVFSLVGVGVLAGAVWAAQSGVRLSINGKAASSDVRTIGGKPYVPLGDVAKAMGMVVVKSGNGYTMKVPGGALQVNGVRQGKIGDWVFSGKWNFQVTGVQQVDEYTERFTQDPKTVKPQSANDVLVIVEAKIKNGVQKTQSPILSERLSGNTHLADKAGQSYGPILIDARQELGKYASYAAAPMLPGSSANVAFVFSVPRDTELKAMVFSALTYPEDVGKKETVDVRVVID